MQSYYQENESKMVHPLFFISVISIVNDKHYENYSLATALLTVYNSIVIEVYI